MTARHTEYLQAGKPEFDGLPVKSYGPEFIADLAMLQKESDSEEVAFKQVNGLTKDKIEEVIDSMPKGINGFLTVWGLEQFSFALERIIKESNALPIGQPSRVIEPSDLLREAAQTIEQRGQERDNGNGVERSMAATVAAFNAIEGTQLTERQGWAFMQVLKMVRAKATAGNGRFNLDDYIDGAAYAALGAECAAVENVKA